MTDISIVIPTSKERVLTLESLKECPLKYEIIFSRSFGFGKARNDGVRQAKNELIVMLDDDLIVDKRVWEIVSNLKPNEFAMINEDWFNPCSRIMAFYNNDFWNVGGFDEKFKYSAEDRDFFFRAIDKGLKWVKIPESYVTHIEHPGRDTSFWKGNKIAFDNFRYYLRHHKKHPELLKSDLRFRFRNYHYRTIGVYCLAFIYFVLFDRSWKWINYEIER